jgi:hypothetical protein
MNKLPYQCIAEIVDNTIELGYALSRFLILSGICKEARVTPPENLLDRKFRLETDKPIPADYREALKGAGVTITDSC